MDLSLAHFRSAKHTELEVTAPAMAESFTSTMISSLDTNSESPAQRFMRFSHLCRARDLRQLFVLCALVKSLSELIHALQKERGASSIYLGSNARRFADHLVQRIAASQLLEREASSQLESIDAELAGTTLSARFYSSVGYALLALDTLPDIRTQVERLALEPEHAVKSYSDVIAAILAVGFEAADLASDVNTARALIALANLAQGKEYAGQERAIAGAALSRASTQSEERESLRRLVAAQERAFRVFAEFASETPAASYRRLAANDDSQQLEHYRTCAFEFGEQPRVGAEEWYELTTRRIDALKAIEEQSTSDIENLCLAKLNEMETAAPHPAEPSPPARVAMLIAHLESPASALAADSGTAMYSADAELPGPLRPIRAVIEAQSQRIHYISTELESARQALAERKLVERAKGLLMQQRRLSEKDAYTLMRQTAMNQNKRLIDIAEAVVSMEDLLRG